MHLSVAVAVSAAGLVMLLGEGDAGTRRRKEEKE